MEVAISPETALKEKAKVVDLVKVTTFHDHLDLDSKENPKEKVKAVGVGHAEVTTCREIAQRVKAKEGQTP